MRKSELEGTNNHLVIIDIKSTNNMRIINIYRPFNPINDVTPRQFFENQLSLIRAAYTNNTLLMGDFNLDWKKRHDNQYVFKNYFQDMERVLYDVPHIQLINRPSWSRMVNTVLRESTLDHVYTNNPLKISNIEHLDPIFGDHCMITLKISYKNQK